ncbi:Chemotaxis protein CheY [Anatilimnocola aggregata]|uniref:Chemotaxis protein CheY n=1 Tax=Anatilimnocola aggregata TaxID=2528021 RepID=A0A517YFB5_9BACT|nr:response regulator [Anatilimnocola aggregata]QDU28919.1 Chemotaxis protein CheY [Anatilimnocola aggregata]
MAKILIVDDSNLARRTTRKILEEAGHTVVDAEDGFTALERYFIEKPNLVMLDVTMREMDGIEVLGRLRQMDANCQAIIVTADIQSSTRQMAADGGAAGFVVKPVTSASLLAAVETALQGGIAPCN